MATYKRLLTSTDLDTKADVSDPTFTTRINTPQVRFTDSNKTSFNHLNVSAWQTAYNWGDHASAGYLTSSPTSLHISNSSGAGHVILETTSSSHGVMLDLRASADKDAEIIFREGANARAIIFNDASNNSLSLSDGSGGLSPVLNIKSGLVGIGCNHPSVPLEVELSGDTGTYFEGGGSGNDASDLRHLTMTASTTTSAGDTHTLNAESGSGVLKFATSGSDRMIVNSTGVGIGISPSVPLHISKATNAGLTEMFIDNSSGGGSTDETVGIRFLHNGATAGGILAGRTEDFSNSPNRSGHLIFKTNNNDSYAERMRISSDGNVGIGTGSDTIDARLHVKGAIDVAKFQSLSGATNTLYTDSSDSLVGQIEFSASASQVVTRTSSTLSLGSNNVQTLHITDDDRVGIGTSSPQKLVHLDASSGYAEMRLSGSSGGGTIEYYNDSTALGDMYFDTNKIFYVRTNGSTQALKIDASQNATFASKIGIGVTPIGTLDINISTNARGSFNDGIGEIGSGVFALQVSNSAGSALKPMGIRAEDIRLVTGSAERMRIDASGNTGIGINSPSTKLHIKGAGEILRIENETNASGNTYMSFHDTSAVKGYLGYTGGSSDHLNIWNVENADVKIATNNTERVTINGATGNVGIGTSSPTVGKLQVNDSSDPILAITRTNGSTSGNLGSLRFGNTNVDSNLANIIGFQDGGTDNSGLKFETQSSGSATAERMRITSSGNVGIGTTTPANKLVVETTTNYDGIVVRNVNDIVRLKNGGGDDGYVQLLYGNTVKSTIHSNGNTYFNGGNVGIGINAPDTNLHLHRATAGSVDSNANSILTIENNTHAGLQFLTPNNANAIIYFGDVDDNDISYIGYLHSTNDLEFFINGGVRFKLNSNSRISLGNNDSSGNIYNTIFGYLAGKSVASGASSNTLIGYETGDAITTGSQNTAIGESALSGTDDGASNVAIGNSALGLGNCGTSNVAIGSQSMVDLTGSYNTAVGMQSLFDLTSGGANVAIGALAMKFANGGESSNIAIGVEAMRDVKENGNTADSNIALGSLAMKGGTLGGDFIGNIAIGDRAMDSTNTNAQTGTIAIGHHSLTALTSGTGNTVLGYQSDYYNETGSNNTFVGYRAGLGASGNSHSSNVGIGFEAMKNIRTGSENVAIGKESMEDVTSGSGNISIGTESLMNLTTGTNNVSIGKASLNASGVNPSNSVAIGTEALRYASGSNNVGIGSNAGDSITTGTTNTCIGHGADVGKGNASNQIAIGQGTIGKGDNTVTLGNASVTDIYMAQDSGAKVHMGDFHLQNSTSFTFNDNASHELCSFEARFTDSPTGTTGAHIAFRSSADDFTSGTETARIANIGTSGNINANHSSSLEFHVISTHTMTKTLTIGSSDGNDRVQLHKGRLQFPATQNADSDANTLDDYEEGTWTATDGSDAGLSLTIEQNTYTKVGNLVTACIIVTYPTTTNKSLARLTLPITADSTGSSAGGAVLEQNISTSQSYTACVNYSDGVIFRLRGGASQQNADLSGKKLRFVITYHST